MASSQETRAESRETGATGGAAPLGGAMAAAEASRREEPGRETEAWAAAVPAVRTLFSSLPLLVQSFSRPFYLLCHSLSSTLSPCFLLSFYIQASS